MKRAWQILSPLLVTCCGASFSWGEDGGVSTVKPDEHIIFFPTDASLSDDGQTWLVPVHGWIFEPEDTDVLRRAALKTLQKALGLDPTQPSTRTFEKRARFFLVDNERHKRIVIRIGETTHQLGPSDRDGHFAGTVSMPVEAVSTVVANDWLQLAAVLPEDDARKFQGSARLLQPTGISVISDIDDTIKVSHVADKKRLLENTLLKPFQAVPEMANIYRQWADDGAAFHFVSSTPWQLYEPLLAFAQEAGFPDATFYLKRMRLKDSTLLSLFADPERTKPQVIEPILRAYPQRRFVLVGDSGEKDAEVYGSIAAKFPEQVVQILIRDVTGESQDAQRYRRAFEHIPATKWTIFVDPNGLRLPAP
jgi:phosphatidate phosphatase APP1